MWWEEWVYTTLILGICVLLSYFLVLFNGAGKFHVDGGEKGYVSSPYWLGVEENSVRTILVFQVVGVIGYVAWFLSLLSKRPSKGIFTDPAWLVISSRLFLIPSVLWPFAANRLLVQGGKVWALISSSCLWIAASGVALMVAGTLEDRGRSPIALTGILLISTVIVVVDGAGWTFAAFRR